MAPPKKTNTDILVAIATIETKVDNLTSEVKEMKDGVKADVEFLKVDKISRAEAVHVNTAQQTINTDIETRVRFIERYGAMALGMVSLGSFLLNYFHPFAR